MPTAPGASRSFTLRASLWLLLGTWIGAWLCFGLVVAPNAFRRLPTIAIAGQLIGPVLDTLHGYGAVAGALLAMLAWRLGRSRALVLLALAAGAACAFSQLVITPQIDTIRELAFGPQGSPEMAARFQHLHRVSVAIYVAVGFTTLALLAGHVRADLRAGASEPA